jgi:multidrug efflux system outer membrane protein
MRRRAAWRATVLVLPMLLAGCDLAPRYHSPGLPTPAAFPGADPGVSNAPVARIGWREFFSDPALQKLIEAALADNRDLRAAASRVLEARENVRVQGSALLPQVNATGVGGRTVIPSALSPLPGGAITTGLDAGLIGADWELDLWGRLRDMRASAREDYLASAEARRAVATSLIAQVTRAWLQAAEYDERIALARHTVVTRRESLRIVRRRFEVGTGARLDMMQAQAVLDEAAADVQALELARVQNLDLLALLVGRPVEVAPFSLAPADAVLTRPLPAGLPSDLLVNRPDILEAEHRLRGAHADIGAARAAFLPRVLVTGAGGTESRQLNMLFGGGSGAWSYLPVISVPLFTGGRNKANLDLAEARRVTAVAEYEHAIQSAFRDVADALAARRWLTGQIRVTQDELAALRERERLAQLRYVSGRSAYLEVLDAQRDLFATEQGLTQLRRAFLASAVALYEAVGGGFPEGPDTTTRSGQAG